MEAIKPPHQNWLALTAIIITVLGFGATTWRDVSNSKDGQTKLELKVEAMSTSMASNKDANQEEFSKLREGMAHIEGKLDVLLERNQAISKQVAIGPSRHLGRYQGLKYAD